MKETAVWRLVKQNLPGHLQRIENMASPGAPDVNACWRGHETWIELKVAKGNYVYFRDAQIAWFARRIKEGGQAVVLIRKGDLLYVVHAKDLLTLTDYIEPAADKACKIKIDRLFGYVTGKPYPWDVIAKKVYTSELIDNQPK